jgi:hypothetical protein
LIISIKGENQNRGKTKIRRDGSQDRNSVSMKTTFLQCASSLIETKMPLLIINVFLELDHKIHKKEVKNGLFKKKKVLNRKEMQKDAKTENMFGE